MIGDDKEDWKVLCEQAAVEQDPQQLVELVKQIDRLLEEKQSRRRNRSPKPNP
jgi:hypothetical protein